MPVAGVLGPLPVYCALSTPRISYSCSKTVICACSSDTRTGLVVHTARWGGVYRVLGGWGIPGTGRVGIPGTYPAVLHWYCQDPTSLRTPLSASARHSSLLLRPPHTWLLALSMAPTYSQ